MAHYGTTQRTDEESRGLLNNNDEVPVTIFGRTIGHVHHHRKRYFALWLFAAVVAITAVVGLHYHHLHDKDTVPAPTPTPGPGTPDKGELGFMSEVLFQTGGKHNPDVCQSDRSYPVAIILSIFFGYVGVDRFYLGYVISALLKLATAGGFGIWYIIDILLIILGALPDHNGCSLVAP